MYSQAGLMEADRLNASLAEAGGGMAGQGRGLRSGRRGEQQLIQQPKVLVEPRRGALQLADARLDGPRLGLRRIDGRTESASEGDRQQA